MFKTIEQQRRSSLDPAIWEELKQHFSLASELSPEDQQGMIIRLRETDPRMADLLCSVLASGVEDFLRGPPWIHATAQGGLDTRVFRIGDIIGDRFEIEEFLGAGGVGEVYRAYDRFRGARVALKTIRPALVSDSSAAAVLRNELNTATLVSHRNVCRSYDITIVPTGASFITMELLEGGSLAERLREGPYSTEEAYAVVVQLINGLAAAHECGVIHRDLKPSNVILAQAEGSVRTVITDFGLARQIKPGSDLATTLSGGFAGTPAYMAPEQLEGKSITSAADLYALGLIMFEMIAGRLPFEGDSPIAVAVARLHGPAPSPRRFVPRIDARWEQAIGACLQRDPAKRPVSAFQILSLLQVAPAARWPRRVLLGAASAAALGGALLIVRPAQRSPQAVEAMQEGVMFSERRTSDGFDNAIREFRLAVRLEPKWAEAWERLADAYGSASNFAFFSPEASLSEARAAARRAIELDEKQARAHGSLAWAQSLDLDEWPQAGKEFGRAVQLDPNNPDVRRWFSAWLRKAGRYREAEEQVRAGVRLTNSTDPRLWTEYLAVLITARRVDRFRTEVAEAHRLFPNDSMIETLEARSLELQGNFDGALEVLDYVARLGLNDGTVLALKAGVAASRGDFGKARTIAANLEQLWKSQPVDGLLLAGIYARTGDRDHAFRVLDEAYRRKDNTLLSLATSPWLDNLRSDPRYDTWLGRLHFSSAILQRMDSPQAASVH